jgi:hypothetical protein
VSSNTGSDDQKFHAAKILNLIRILFGAFQGCNRPSDVSGQACAGMSALTLRRFVTAKANGSRGLRYGSFELEISLVYSDSVNRYEPHCRLRQQIRF